MGQASRSSPGSEYELLGPSNQPLPTEFDAYRVVYTLSISRLRSAIVSNASFDYWGDYVFDLSSEDAQIALMRAISGQDRLARNDPVPDDMEYRINHIRGPYVS